VTALLNQARRLNGLVARYLSQWESADGSAVDYPADSRTRGCSVGVRERNKWREAKNGLWTDPQPVPPWEWRKQRR